MAVSEKTQTLFVKSFFAATVQEAMAQARVELGPDALLLNSREAPPEARHLGAFEVVFGGGAPGAVASVPTVSAAAAEAEETSDDLRGKLDEIRIMLGRIAPPAQGGKQSGAVEQALVEAGLERMLAQDIEAAVRLRTAKRVAEFARPRVMPDSSAENVLAETAREIGSRFEVKAEVGRIAALVGPPGSGKTTTLVKLAITQGLAQGRAVRLISADTQRIGGAEQLRTYAAILGVPFQAVEGVGALAQALESLPANTMALIDTPGYSGALLAELGGELAGFLHSRQDVDTHLVLTAAMGLTNLLKISDKYAGFGAKKLLFTRLDETSSLASVFSVAVRQDKPLSFFSRGQLVPEDLEAASKEEVTESLVRQLPEVLRAVA